MIKRISMDSKTFTELRVDYGEKSLHESTVLADPLEQFGAWFADIKATGAREPNAMALATVGSNADPSLRMVLLKDVSEHGFVFYTNYLSQKGRDIELHSHVALLFYWPELERQVRVEGKAQKVSREASDTYFSSRPRDAQVSAIVSPQSVRVNSREELELKYEKVREGSEQELTRPESWGGYCVFPARFEFWQGRKSRLHDRIEYSIDNSGNWNIRRLAP